MDGSGTYSLQPNVGGKLIRRSVNTAACSAALEGCPDLLELQPGDFAVIGIDITAKATGKLPAGVSGGRDERVVLVLRRTVVLANADIPDRV
jgi:hypothetical protein